jgi:hypothetical protein
VDNGIKRQRHAPRSWAGMMSYDARWPVTNIDCQRASLPLFPAAHPGQQVGECSVKPMKRNLLIRAGKFALLKTGDTFQRAHA